MKDKPGDFLHSLCMYAHNYFHGGGKDSYVRFHKVPVDHATTHVARLYCSASGREQESSLATQVPLE